MVAIIPCSPALHDPGPYFLFRKEDLFVLVGGYSGSEIAHDAVLS
jgi:K+/H+ antiporter YhaU regulatory subunit KhtT